MQQDLEARIQSVVEAVLADGMEGIRRELADRLRSDFDAFVDTRLRESTSQAAEKARRETAEALADGVRRIRSEQSVTAIAVALVETAAGFAERCAMFIHKGERLLGFRLSGPGAGEKQASFEILEVPLPSATAVAHAIETRDTVVAGGAPGDLSDDVVRLFGLAPEDRVHLFPIVLRDKVLAVLYADGGESGREVERPAIETLRSVAEAWLEAVGTRKRPVSQPEEAAAL